MQDRILGVLEWIALVVLVSALVAMLLWSVGIIKTTTSLPVGGYYRYCSPIFAARAVEVYVCVSDGTCRQVE